jgi:hypothetical protein
MVIVLAMTGIRAMHGGVIAISAGRNGCRDLQAGALPPSRRTGNQRKRDGQRHDTTKSMPHGGMLASPTRIIQQLFSYRRNLVVQLTPR